MPEGLSAALCSFLPLDSWPWVFAMAACSASIWKRASFWNVTVEIRMVSRSEWR